MYTPLLQSHNYVARRQSLKLLGEILRERASLSVMFKCVHHSRTGLFHFCDVFVHDVRKQLTPGARYVGSADNLNQTMMLLCDKCRSIQLEAFHVFKLFVANPRKTDPVLEILVRNKDELIAFLRNFGNPGA